MQQLEHNGVMVPPLYEAQGLTVKIKGREHKLTPEQEERAVAWAKKIGTPYVEDPVFAENFHRDFGEVLGFEVQPGDVDYTDIYRMVVAERERKQNMPSDEKKRARDQQKVEREANKERYGYATINGERCELGNYMVEPSGIFMGRGKHPFRGRWKEGPREEDIELNHIPKEKAPQGKWKTLEDPESMWIARWKDRLTGKMKYVWPHDSSPIKQQKEREKFDKAVELRRNLGRVQRHILDNLTSPDLRRRKTATVSYLIDALKFRVGDEKDEEDEADTVGASSLRTEHITFNPDGSITFDFLGKDSIPLKLTTTLDPRAAANLREFAEANSGGPLFEEVNSSVVSEFLGEVMEGVTAKVFRTCHATEAVERRLRDTEVRPDEPEYRKRHVATLANLDAAITCNHKRTIPKTWEQGLQRQRERLEKAKRKARENLRKRKQSIQDAIAKHESQKARLEARLEEERASLQKLKDELKQKGEQGKPTGSLEKRVAAKQKSVRATRERIQQAKSRHRDAAEKLNRQTEEQRRRDQEAVEKLGLQLEARELTRDYNLGTSLKSYVDPRVYLEWGRRVDYDWRSYYSDNLAKKFSWADPQPDEDEV